MGAVRYTPANTSTGGTTGSSTAQLIQPLDLNGANNGNPLLLVNSINALGAITATNYYNPVTMALTGLPAGTASIKVQTDLDVYSIILQDTLVKFIREYFIADGGSTAYTKDVTLSGAPYIPVGAVTAVTAGDATAANQVSINNNISVGNNFLSAIFGIQQNLLQKKFRPTTVKKFTIPAAGVGAIDSLTFVVCAYDSNTGVALSMIQLGVLAGGVNAAIVSNAELANFNKILPTIEIFNTNLAGFPPTDVIRNWKNPNAFDITLIGVQYI